MTNGIRKVWGNFIDEKDYQHFFVDRLVEDNGFVRRENKHIDQATAMDAGMLIEFLEDTQPKAMAALAKTYGAKRDAIIAAKVNQLLTQKVGGGFQRRSGRQGRVRLLIYGATPR